MRCHGAVIRERVASALGGDNGRPPPLVPPWGAYTLQGTSSPAHFLRLLGRALVGATMPDRVLRSALFDSDRWLDLPDDTCKLAYVCLLSLADDYGNLEGGRRLFRWLSQRVNVKQPEHVARAMSHLADCDLVRRYEVDGKECFHVPRFRCRLDYITQVAPASPYDDPSLDARAADIRKRRREKAQRIKATSANVQRTSVEGAPDMGMTFNEGVGVGVGVGVGEKGLQRGEVAAEPAGQAVAAEAKPDPKGTRLPRDWVLPDDWAAWAETEGRARNPPITASRGQILRTAESFRDYWHGKAGQNARKVDWQATWRNWWRSTDARSLGAPGKPGGHPDDLGSVLARGV
jgi:hypothetical protein